MADETTGRCGECAFFMRYYRADLEVQSGDCRLWKAARLETGTCPSFKPLGGDWNKWSAHKPAAGMPRRMRSETERTVHAAPPLPKEIDLDMDTNEFREVLRQILREELGTGDTEIGERWRGGELVMQPGRKETQEKRVPLDAFFHKIVMLRDKLRVLEQKINGHEKLSDDEKVQMQQYVTACYGTLTTFNVLFRDKEDQFAGQKGSRD